MWDLIVHVLVSEYCLSYTFPFKTIPKIQIRLLRRIWIFGIILKQKTHFTADSHKTNLQICGYLPS